MDGPNKNPAASVNVEQCFHRPSQDNPTTVRIRNPNYRGYSVRAYNPEGAGPFRDLSKAELETVQFACKIAPQKTVEQLGVTPWPVFENAQYVEVFRLAEDYNQLPRTTTECRKERIELLTKLEKLADEYLAQDSLNEKRRKFVQEEIKDRIPEEKRLLFGIPQKVGKIYLPEDEESVRENFARGNSASVSKIHYKPERPGEPGFTAVFKASTPEQEVQADAAIKFGIKGNSETARLSHRSVWFYEKDQLLGMNLTPPTFYAIHQGQPGSVQEFVEASHVIVRKYMDEAFHENNIFEVPQIVRGEYLEYGRSFRLSEDSGCTEDQLTTMNDQELMELYNNKEIILTREKTVDIPPLDLRHPKTQQALANAQLLDHIAGSVDRNPSNIFFIEKTDEHGKIYYDIKLIDNDLCAAPESVHSNVETRSPKSHYQRNMAGKIPSLVDNESAQKLSKLSLEEVGELLEEHQLALAEIVISQRERMTKCASEMASALNSPNKKTEVSYRHITQAAGAKAYEGTKHLRIGEVDGDKTILTFEDLIIVEEWNEETYQQALDNKDSYLFKIYDCRVAELIALMESNPERTAEIWRAQFHLMGGRRMAESMGEQPVVMTGQLTNYLAVHCVVDCENLSDIKEIASFAHAITRTEMQRLKPVEQARRTDQIIRLMLASQPTVTARQVGQAIRWNPSLSAHTAMELLPLALDRVKATSADEQASIDVGGSGLKQPSSLDKIALDECIAGAEGDKGAESILNFWDSFSTTTISKYKERHLGSKEIPQEEFAHAMAQITPDTLTILKRTPYRHLRKKNR